MKIVKCAKIKQMKGDTQMYKESFHLKLKQARLDIGFTQKETSTELNIPRSTLANYEVGRTEPDIETLCKLIDFYQADANWILGTGKHK